MKKILKKFLVISIILIMCLFSSLPIVQATYSNTTNNLVQKESEVNENLTQNNFTNDESISYSDFEIVLSGILNEEKNQNITLDNVGTIISNKPEHNGIWIEEESRNFILSLINSLTNKIYKIDDDGFLTEDKNSTKSQTSEKLDFYTEKIDEMISGNKLILFSINDTYKNFNKEDQSIIDIRLEDEEYTLLFKENENDEEDFTNIVILNSEIYNKDNTEETVAFLLNKILEVYYNEDDDFKSLVEDTEFIDNSGIYSDVVKTEEELVSDEENDIIKEDTNNIINEATNNLENENITPTEDNTINITKKEPSNLFDDSISKEEFDLLVAGILSQNVENNNIQNILIDKPANDGIWISENSREAFINFLNEHTIYTYSIDSNGYLICDNIMKDNPNLDMYEKMETEVDIEIKNILQKNVLIIVDLNNSYYMYDENNNIVKTQLQNEDYLKSFSFENQRAIILNNEYYSKSEFNLALSDYFVKALDNVQEKVATGELTFNKQPLTRSDTSKPGNMLSAQTVYAGPSSSNYATVGSVSSGEMIYLLGQQSGWYHIQYMVTGTSQQKSGFVPVSTVNNNGYSVHEEQMTGGQNFATSTVSIMSCDDTSIDLSLGTVYAGEGMTVLYTYTYIDSSKSYDIAYVEISTPSGTKRGYIPTSSLTGINYPSSVARVTATNSAYSGPDSSFVKLGGAYYNAFVTILAKNTGNNWVLVEYNTSSGRKRGFMDYTKLYNYNHPGMYNDLPVFTALKQATQQLTVYGGPSTNAANIGLIYNQEVVSLLNTERGFAYIEYNTTNGAKRGYVTESSLINASAPSIPNINAYSFSEGTYGTSGLGKSLKYYKIGNGSNVAFAVFEQHGWEDAWAYDGIELINIAQDVIQNLSSTGISNNWTLYIIPYANPDGVTNGYTNNGPGRCTVTTGIDMNRCWPANFRPYYTSRNYTGGSALGAPEAQALKSFIENNIGNGKKIVLDIHGWLNQTYGDSEVASYFTNQFGFGHSSSYGSGYLETWGKSIGAQSCLVELPMPSSSASITNNNYSGKVSNAIRNMLNGIGGTATEGGTEVNEQVVVTANPSLNVRSGPGISYGIVASVSNGTTVTRIRKSVATANGYTWDKIRLNNGTEGYVATNYLSLVQQEVPTTETGGGKNFTRNTNWDSIIPDADAKASIDLGEDEYNSMSWGEHLLWDEDLRNYKTIIYAGVTTLQSKYPNAAPAIKYFLTRGEEGKTDYQYAYETGLYTTGHTMRRISLSTALDQNTAMREKLIGNIDDAIEAAEKFCVNSNTSVTFYNETEDHGIAYRQDSLTDLEADWYLAVNQYRIKMQCSVTRSGNSYQMQLRYGMIDYYDWHVADNKDYSDILGESGIEGFIIDGLSMYFELMHRAGISRNYTNYGETTYTVTWTQGQRTSTGASYNRN